MILHSRRFSVALALAVGLCAGPVPLHAQEGRISGTVRDARGEPVAAGRVTVTNSATRATRGTMTAANGSYSISGLTPGAYSVSASMFGFRRQVRADVQVPSSGTVDFVLEPLPLQAITVTATPRGQELAD